MYIKNLKNKLKHREKGIVHICHFLRPAAKYFRQIISKQHTLH